MAKSLPQFEQIVGVVGGAASGKDTVAEYFSQYGFSHISSSDLVREEIARRGQQTSRELQTVVANELRQTHGVGYWVDLSLEQIIPGAKKVVVSGLYSPGEGRHLIDKHFGIIVGVSTDGDNSIRFDRLMSRASGARDALTLEDFMAAHHRENSGTYEYETNLGRLLTMAKFMIHNTAGLDQLKQQTLAVINALERSSI